MALRHDYERGEVEPTDLLHVYEREPVGKASLIVRVRWVDFLSKNYVET